VSGGKGVRYPFQEAEGFRGAASKADLTPFIPFAAADAASKDGSKPEGDPC